MSVEQLDQFLLSRHEGPPARAYRLDHRPAQRQAWLQQFIILSDGRERRGQDASRDRHAGPDADERPWPIQKALEPGSGTYLSEVLRTTGGESDKIEQLCLAALSGKPTSKELAAMHKLLRTSSRSATPQASGVEGYQDLFWRC